MRIIDAHNHLYAEPGYLDLLLRTMDSLGIEKCCLSGLGSLFGFADNAAVEAAFRAHPDRIVGAYFVRPGLDDGSSVYEARERGFRILKVTLPRIPYDDPAGFPLWAAAMECGMPVLFHTGIVTVRDAPGEGISSWNMHPMRIEPITREFPELPVIIAHLGIHWNRDAAELARMRRNVYVDLTGEPGGWRVYMDRIGLDHWLWWPGAFRKIVFGTDVHARKMGVILEQDRQRLARFGVDAETQAGIFGETILRLLG